MGIKENIDITAAQKKIVLDLLKKHIPNIEVWAYGSRVTGTTKPCSDLDIVALTADGHRENISNLKEAFEESDLPFRVDLFVWDQVPENFHKIIKKKYVVLQAGQKDKQSPGRPREGDSPLSVPSVISNQKLIDKSAGASLGIDTPLCIDPLYFETLVEIVEKKIVARVRVAQQLDNTFFVH